MRGNQVAMQWGLVLVLWLVVWELQVFGVGVGWLEEWTNDSRLFPGLLGRGDPPKYLWAKTAQCHDSWFDSVDTGETVLSGVYNTSLENTFSTVASHAYVCIFIFGKLSRPLPVQVLLGILLSLTYLLNSLSLLDIFFSTCSCFWFFSIFCPTFA